MIKQFLEKHSISGWKIRTKFILLIIIMAVLSLTLYGFLWKIQGRVCHFLEKQGIFRVFDEDKFISEVRAEAKKYNVPEKEEDRRGREAIEPFFEKVTDKYTGLSIYGTEDGLYRCGSYPEILDTLMYGSIVSRSMTILGEEVKEASVTFKNGTYDIVYSSYHRSRFTYPYVITCALTCILLFLSVIFAYVGSVIKRILKVKDSIVSMAGGNLEKAVPDCGKDEVGTVARELDGLRVTLAENIQKESESRQANQDLITAMSHDLRTPLTVLNGYLEILRLKQLSPSAQSEYIGRCLKKTADIKALTDKMFEYALVYEESENVQLRKLPAAVLQEILEENCDFIRLAGFTAEADIRATESTIFADEIMLKRIFSNLFSNILKYGDKSGKVYVGLITESGRLKVSLTNAVRPAASDTESNRIGLRSTEKMVRLHGGKLYTLEENNIYTVQIEFVVE